MLLFSQFIIFLLASSVISKKIPKNDKEDVKPTYKSDPNNVDEARFYSNLLAGLQKIPHTLTPYSGYNLRTYSGPYLLPYALQTNAPGYPASTWPLKREQIPSTLVEPQVSVQNVRVTPYINGLFGFGALKNKIIPQKSGCPAGYAEMYGDVPGWGTSLGSKVRATREECAARCDRYVDCLSFEHSNTEFLCNLNTVEDPSVGQYKDYAFCSKIQNLDNQGNIIQHVQPINQPIVPSGGTNKIINDNIEKLQHESRHPDESQVLTNMTLCFFTGDDILKSHLMFNDRWRFDRYNLKGLKTYVNDLTFGANIHLGRRNYQLSWRGPFKRSDASSRYPGKMENDTKRTVDLGVCDATVFLVFNDFQAENATDGHKFSGFVKGAPCENHLGSGYIVMVDQGFWGTEWTGPQVLAHQLLRLLTADVCAGLKPYADKKANERVHWNTNCFCKNEDSLLHPYIKPGEQHLDQCVIDKLNKSDISLRYCLLPNHY